MTARLYSTECFTYEDEVEFGELETFLHVHGCGLVFLTACGTKVTIPIG
jgi:hypothetical protein